MFLLQAEIMSGYYLLMGLIAVIGVIIILLAFYLLYKKGPGRNKE